MTAQQTMPPAPPAIHEGHSYGEWTKQSSFFENERSEEDDDDEEEDYMSSEEDEEENEEVDDNEEDNADDLEDPTSRAMHEIFRFIASLRSKGILTEAQTVLLEELLFENSTLLFAAYSVAVSAKDAEYFAQICCGIAQSLESEEGRDTCSAQDEVLHICDKLYLGQKITENQLLYLRHLVLIRDESIGDLYDDYAETGEVVDMMRALYVLANTHPKMQQQQAAKQSQTPVSDTDEEQGSDDEDEIQGKQTFSPSQAASSSSITMNARLQSVISQMFQHGLVSRDEGRLLLEMVADGDEYCRAAYEVWHHDGNLGELCDTLLRCVKLEFRKRAAAKNQAMIEARIAEDPTAYPTYGEESGEGESASQTESQSKDMSVEESEESEESDESSDASEDGKQVRVKNDLDSVLESLGVQNSWATTVPQLFVNIVFVAAQRKVLSVGQARALCDLYQAQYDLVRAAWEVFSIEQDARDLIDTLKRVVRDLNFDDAGNVSFQAAATEDSDTDTKQQSAATTKQASPQKSVSVPISEAVRRQAEDANREQGAKRDALTAVQNAKRDLLKHSLDMMVKQGLVTEEGAASVYNRSSEGDALVDAAIEQYANDRDVAEFLETLQILASLSKEEIDALMRDAADRADESDNKERKNFTSASSNSVSTSVQVPPREDSETDEESEEEDKESSESSESSDDEQQSPEQEYQQDVQFPIGSLIELYKRQLLSSETVKVLRDLIVAKHPHVLAAFDVYREMQDVEDLVDSLKRIARHHGAPAASQNNASSARQVPEEKASEKESDSSNSEESSEEETESESEESSEDSDEEPGSASAAVNNAENYIPILPVADQKKVVGILGNAGAFNAKQVATLESLVDQQSFAIRKLFVEYERRRNVTELIQGLMEALPMAEATPAVSSAPTSVAQPITDSDSESEDSEDSEDETQESLASDGSIEQKFLAIIKEMQLSHLETAALRLAIARNDTAIRAALETFRVNVNEQQLIHSLREVARATMVATLEGKLSE